MGTKLLWYSTSLSALQFLCYFGPAAQQTSNIHFINVDADITFRYYRHRLY